MGNIVAGLITVAIIFGFCMFFGIIVLFIVESDPQLWNRFTNLGVVIGTYDYKGYAINYDYYGRKEFTIDYGGTEYEFRTIKAAAEFIDSISEPKRKSVIDFGKLKAF